MDHHCIFANACVGARTHGPFVLFLVAFLATYAVFLSLTAAVLAARAAETGVPCSPYRPSSWFGLGLALLEAEGTVLAASVWTLVPYATALRLLVFHTRLVLTNLTTNEYLNAHRYRHFWRVRVQGTPPHEAPSIVLSAVVWRASGSETISIPGVPAPLFSPA